LLRPVKYLRTLYKKRACGKGHLEFPQKRRK
jgi:hypothetical protein